MRCHTFWLMIEPFSWKFHDANVYHQIITVKIFTRNSCCQNHQIKLLNLKCKQLVVCLFCEKKFSKGKLNMKYFFYDQINNIRWCKTKCFFHDDRMSTKTAKCMCVCQFTRLWKYFDLNLHVKPQKQICLSSCSRFFCSPMVSSNDEHDNV